MENIRNQSINRGISLMMAVILMASVFYVQTIEVKAADEILTWERNRTMDINFNKGNSERGSDNMMFSFDIAENGIYELEYYLKNGEQTKVYFDKQLDNLSVYYSLNEKDSGGGGTTVSKLGDPGDSINMKQVDYSGIPTRVNLDKPIIDLNGVGITTTSSSAISFDIEYAQSANVTGFAFELGGAAIPNRQFIADWDRPNNKMYIWFNGYVDGNIMPMKLSAPGDDGTPKTDQLYILKNLEDFEISPVNPSEVDSVIVEYDGTNPKEQAGSHPGMEITFKHPKTWNETDWTYNYDAFTNDVNASFSLEELTNSNNLLELGMGLNQYDIGNTEVNVIGLPGTADYVYNLADNTYTIYIAQDASEVNSSIENNTIIWPDLASSKLYEATFSVGLNPLITGEERYRTDFFEMNAYTYLEYKVVRVDDEAYLDIKPYYVENAQNIYYEVRYADQNINDDISQLEYWSSYYPTRTDEDTIRLVVDAQWSTDYNFYQVMPVWKSTKLNSQVLNYKAKNHEDSGRIAPKLPELIAPRGEDISVFEDIIKFDLQWVGTDRDRWIYDAVYYEVLIGEQSALDTTASNQTGYDVFAIYKIIQNTDDEYELWRIISGTLNSPGLELVGTYDSFEEITGEDGVMLKNAGELTQAIDSTYTYNVGDYYEYNFSFPENSKIKLALAEQEVYYLRMRAIAEVSDSGIISHIKTDYSVPKSITLSETVRELPEIELTINESLIEEEKVGAYLEWQEITKQNPKLHDYIRLFLDPQRDASQGGINISEDTTIKYKVLLSESREALLYEGDYDPINNDPSNFSDEIPLGSATANITPEQLQTFQETNPIEVLVFDVPTNSIGLLGLEENKVYYSRVITTLEVTESATDTTEYYSEPSEVISITTPTLPVQPDEGDLDPLSPNNFDVRFKPDDEIRLETEVTWNLPDGLDADGDSFEFEVVAFEEEGFPNVEAATEVSLMDVYTDMLEDPAQLQENIDILEALIERGVVQGWRVVKDGEDYRYTMLTGYSEAGEPIYDGETGLCRIDPDSDDLIILEDNENRPNQVYYYYIRSINAYNNTMMSSWRVDTITTGRIQTATNLTVVYDEINDPYYETVIRFDLPLGANYLDEIHIRSEQDEEYVIARPGTGADNSGDYRYQLIQTEELTDTRRLYYRITGLESGTYYSIKVRLIDDTQTDEVNLDGNPAYPESAFSETVTTRTDFNQDDYEEDLKYQEYLDYYREQAEKLKQKPYFQLEESRNRVTYKYRDAYGIGLIETNRNRSIQLVVEAREQTTYYLPAEFIQALNDGQVMLVFEQKGQKLSLRPESIGLDFTSAIGKIQEEINRYNAKNRDYFVEILIEVDEDVEKVLSYNATSPQIDISMNVLGSEVLEEEVDLMFLNELDYIIRSKEPELIDELTDELEQGINDARLVDLVQTLVKEVEDEFYDEGQDIFEDVVTGTSYRIETVAKPMIYELSPIRSTNVQNHKVFQDQNGRWTEQIVAYVSGKYQLQSTQLLPLILANYYMDEAISENYESEALSALSQYNLLEVLGETALKNPQSSLRNQQFIQIMARILGAVNGEDHANYLKNQGIDVPRLSAYNDILNEDAYYLYVQVYAKKNRIDLNTVRIRDYQMLEDINEVNETYRDTILKGANGQFIDLPYGLINAKQRVTVEQLMTLLKNIDR